MKQIKIIALFLFLLTAVSATVRAQDLSMREAAYFQFYDNGKINMNTPYVRPGETFKINKSATTQSAEGFKFAVGFVLFRDSVTFPPAGFKVNLTSGDNTSSLIFQFADGEIITQARHETPFLKMGVNRIKVVIDPDGQIAESNESNNGFEFNIEVVEDKKDAPKIKTPKSGDVIKPPKGKN